MAAQPARQRLLPTALSGLVLISTAFLLGAFYTHWIGQSLALLLDSCTDTRPPHVCPVDHPVFWTHEPVRDDSLRASLEHYALLARAPPSYALTLALALAVALASCVARLALVGIDGMLFEGACALLLASVAAVHGADVWPVLDALFLKSHTDDAKLAPLDGAAIEGASLPSLHHADLAAVSRLSLLTHTTGLKSLASSHMIIAVSLTGVLMLRAAASYSSR